MNNMRLIAHVVIFIGLLLFTASCSQTSPGQVSKTPTVANSKPTSIVTPTLFGGASAKLGPLPQNCPPGPAPHAVVSNTGPVIGASPVWAGNFVGPHAMLVWSPAFASQFHNQYGWSHKLLWIVEDSIQGLVMLQGANLRDGSSLRPDAEQKAPTSSPTMLVLNPQDPNLTNHVDHWAEFPGALTIPKAGCYFLEAAWPGGHWRITFAAGEVAS